MKLYHGTSSKNLTKILSDRAIMPRGNAPGNWQPLVPSREDFVYLTTAYPIYYGINAIPEKDWDARNHRSIPVAIIEIDTDRIDVDLLAADEDAVEQSMRGINNELPVNWDYRRRISYYRDRAHAFSHEKSLQLLGSCGHIGPIRSDAITRVALVDVVKQPLLMSEAMSVSIDVDTHMIAGLGHSGMLKWVFGDELSGDELDFIRPISLMGRSITPMRWPTIKNRNGIKVVNLDARTQEEIVAA